MQSQFRGPVELTPFVSSNTIGSVFATQNGFGFSAFDDDTLTFGLIEGSDGLAVFAVVKNLGGSLPSTGMPLEVTFENVVLQLPFFSDANSLSFNLGPPIELTAELALFDGDGSDDTDAVAAPIDLGFGECVTVSFAMPPADISTVQVLVNGASGPSGVVQLNADELSVTICGVSC